MTILVCGSMAYDTIMVFPDRFQKHILPDQIHILNVAFMVPEMRREFGGTAGNIAYNLKLLGEDPQVMATVGHDFGPYDERLQSLGISQRHVKRVDNQITAFHPGAMTYAHLNRIADAPGTRLAIVSPDGRQGMVEHARDLASAKVRYIFDPGQGLPMFEGPDLLAMMDGAAALAVNDYEARVVEQKTGRKVEQLAQAMERSEERR